MSGIEDTTLWAVHTNDDLTEGRGRQYIKHFCRTEATAKRLAKRAYVQGTDCPITTVKVLFLDGKNVIPANLINVVEPTDEDIAADRRIASHREAIERAKTLGLTDEDIKAIRGNVP